MSTICSAPASGTRCACPVVMAASGPTVAIDLPYSNFAYGQTGTPWPVNQAVYVDYMLYGLRGYDDDRHRGARRPVPQQPGSRRPRERLCQLAGLHAGHALCGRAELPAVPRSRRLRPVAAQIAGGHGLVPGPAGARVDAATARRAASCAVRSTTSPARGLGLQPGLSLRGARPVWTRARAARPSARGRGSAEPHRQSRHRSPVPSARRSTHRRWCSSAMAPGRHMCRPKRSRRGVCSTQWYATDVDTGAAHLLRLKALPARGLLADALLNDHEDNLFYKGWGIANEPVYNQHATAYLLRDEPEAVVRASTATWPAPSATRCSNRSSTAGARPVLRAAEHGRRLVRALPQHAGSRARR